MLNLLLALAVLTGLSTLRQVMRVLTVIVARLLAMTFFIALAIILLLGLATHGTQL